MNYSVFDLETIPNLTLPDDLRPKPDLSKVKYGNLKNVFDRAKVEASYVAEFEAKIDKIMSLDPYLCQVCCVVCHDRNGAFMEFSAVDEGTEIGMLQLFWKWAKDRYDQNIPLVGFNTASFDFPVLIVRSMLLDVAVDANMIRNLLKRQDGGNIWHIDLMQRLGHRNPFNGQIQVHNLDWNCRRFGLPGKQDDMDGSKVWPMFQEGKLSEIVEYCKQDVMATASLMERVAPWIYQAPVRNYGEQTQEEK